MFYQCDGLQKGTLNSERTKSVTSGQFSNY